MDAPANASDATARAALSALGALGTTFPAASVAAAAAILKRATFSEIDPDAEGGSEQLTVKPGLEGVVDAAASVLCARAGVDASDETTEHGERGPAAAAGASLAVAALEAALVGPGGGADDSGASEARRAWLLSQATSLARGVKSRRELLRRSDAAGGWRGKFPSAAAAEAAAKRAGRVRRDHAAEMVEAAETAAMFPRLRYLVEDIAGLPDCQELDRTKVTDASAFAPASLRSPASRVALTRTIRTLLELDTDVFQPHFGVALTSMLTDVSGVVRRAAGREMSIVLSLFDGVDQPFIFRDRVATRLALHAAAALPGDNIPSPPTKALDDAPRAGSTGGGEMSAAAKARAAEAARTRGDEYEEGADDAADAAADGGGGESPPYGGAAAAAAASRCVTETSILALGRVACACPAVESACVFLLAAHCAATTLTTTNEERNDAAGAHARLCAEVLTRLATSLGYPSRRAFVKRHARSIGALWMRAGLSVAALLAVPDLLALGEEDGRVGGAAADAGDADADAASASLAKAWAPFVLPAAALAGDVAATRALEDAARVERGDLVREHLAPIFAQLHALSTCESEQRRHEKTAAVAALHGTILASAGGGTLDARLFRKLTDIAAEMTLLAQPSDDADDASVDVGADGEDVDDVPAIASLTPPYLSTREVVRAGELLPSRFSKITARRKSEGVVLSGAASAAETRASNAMWEGDRPYRCVSALRADLDGAAHARHRRRGLAGVEALTRLLGPEALRPDVARSLCHVLLPHVVVRGVVGETATRLLRALVGGPIAKNDWSAVPGGADGLGAEALADNLQPIASTLAAAAEGGGAAAASLLTDLVHGAGATSQAKVLRLAAQALTPLPRLDAHVRMTRATAMPTRLRVLVDRVPRLPPRLRRLAMRDAVNEAVERRGEIVAGGASAAADAWRLAALAVEGGDETQTARVGELLAALGPSAREDDDDDDDDKNGAAAGGGGRSGGGAVDEQGMRKRRGGDAKDATRGCAGAHGAAAADPNDPALAAAVLRRLSYLLCDASHAVADAAAETARLVLAARISRAALTKLSPLERAYLSPLAPSQSVPRRGRGVRGAGEGCESDRGREGGGVDRGRERVDPPAREDVARGRRRRRRRRRASQSRVRAASPRRVAQARRRRASHSLPRAAAEALEGDRGEPRAARGAPPAGGARGRRGESPGGRPRARRGIRRREGVPGCGRRRVRARVESAARGVGRHARAPRRGVAKARRRRSRGRRRRRRRRRGEKQGEIARGVAPRVLGRRGLPRRRGRGVARARPSDRGAARRNLARGRERDGVVRRRGRRRGGGGSRARRRRRRRRRRAADVRRDRGGRADAREAPSRSPGRDRGTRRDLRPPALARAARAAAAVRARGSVGPGADRARFNVSRGVRRRRRRRRVRVESAASRDASKDGMSARPRRVRAVAPARGGGVAGGVRGPV